MVCPKCGSSKNRVLNSRGQEQFVRRRRECFSCGHRFSTVEVLEKTWRDALRVRELLSL